MKAIAYGYEQQLAKQSRAIQFGSQLLLFAAYVLTASIGLRFPAINGFATLLWAPTGLAMAALLIGGIRFSLAVFLGAGLVNFVFGASASAALGIALGNTLEALTGFYLLRHVARIDLSLSRLRDVFYFLLFGPVVSSAVSATFGVSSLFLAQILKAEDLGLTWVTWWVGDALGCTIITPLILSYWTKNWSRPSWRFTVEGLIFSFGLGATAFFIFGGFAQDSGIPTSLLPYSLIPFVIWAALRFGQVGHSTTVIAISIIAIAGTLFGFGPFGEGPLPKDLFFLNFYLMIIGVTGLILAAAMSERQQAMQERMVAETALWAANEELERKIQSRTEEIQGSQEFLNSMIENLPNMVFVKDAKELRFVRFNKAGEDLLGYSREVFFGKNDYDFFPKEQADYFTSKDRDVLESKTLLDIPEEVIQTRYRGERILHTRKIPILDTNGDPLFLLGISEDITGHKEAEEQRTRLQVEKAARDEAEKSIHREMLISRASALLAGSLDYGKNLLALANLLVPEFADWCAIDVIDEQGEARPFVLVHRDPSKLEQVRAFREKFVPRLSDDTGMAKVLRTGEPLMYSEINDELTRRLSRDDEHFQALRELGISSAVVVALTSRGEMFGAITLISAESKRTYTASDLSLAVELAQRAGVAVDNSLLYAEAEKQKNQQLLERQKVEKLAQAAEAANQAKSLFLANMSHEIRTPLGVILGFTDLLKDPDLTAEEREKYSQAVTRNGRALTQLIEDILDISKVEAGRLEVETIETSLPHLMSDISSLLEIRAQENGLGFSVEVAGSIPDTIYSDPARLRQILINIVGNAIKFTQRGSVRVIVSAEPSGEEANKICFSVEDTGPGISKEQADRLFNWFTQADATTTRKFGGTGLGLALSRRLARGLGGDVVLAESSAQGSKFLITVATNLEQRPTSVAASPESSVQTSVKTAPERPLNHWKILLVDDSPDNRALVKKVLERRGAQVDLAQNGREGVDMALSHDYALILMDVQMPVLDGLQATQELRSKGYQKPIIALTAHAMKEEREKTLAAGCSAHLTKPIDVPTLIQVITTYAQS